MENKRSLFSAIPSAIIAGIIAGMIVYFGLNFGGYKEYQAQAKVVTTNIESIEDSSNTASTYAATINSPKIKQRTLETLSLDWNVGKLDTKLDIVPIEGTAIIDIRVTDTNKLRAEDIADQYADYTVRVINNIYNSGAQVMEYSYGSASTLDNTLRYALILGGLFALLWAIIKMLMINSHNKKVEKAYLRAGEAQVKEVREVKKSPSKKAKAATSISPKEVEKKEEKTAYHPSNDEAGQTRVIAKDEVEKATATNSVKYEVLGRIPSYEKGDLDV